MEVSTPASSTPTPDTPASYSNAYTTDMLRPLLPHPSLEYQPLIYHSSALPPTAALPAVSPPSPASPKEPAKMSRLSDFEKGQIAALWEEYHHIPKIQERLLAYGGKRRSYTVIKAFLDRWQQRGDYGNAKATGRRPKVGKEERERIKAAVLERRGWTWSRLNKEIAPQIALKTLRKVVAGEYDTDYEGAEESESEEETTETTGAKPKERVSARGKGWKKGKKRGPKTSPYELLTKTGKAAPVAQDQEGP
jgi:transposase